MVTKALSQVPLPLRNTIGLAVSVVFSPKGSQGWGGGGTSDLPAAAGGVSAGFCAQDGCAAAKTKTAATPTQSAKRSSIKGLPLGAGSGAVIDSDRALSSTTMLFPQDGIALTALLALGAPDLI